MSTYKRIAAVTGGNKGIGLACVRQLALKYSSSQFNDGPLLIYLTARNQQRGEAALKEILQDKQLKKAKALREDGGLSHIEYLALDIDSKESIQSFADYLKNHHPEGIDILINNAGIAMQGFNADVVKQTLHSNYYGTLEVTKQVLPQIRSGGRVVNVASAAGHLNSSYDASIRNRFLKATKTEEITTLMEEFLSAVRQDNYKGVWPGSAYRVSKAGVIGMTGTTAMEHARTDSKTLINSCCPGYVSTDMTKGNGTKTVDQGAETPVLLALGDIGNSNGKFWQNERMTSWGQ